MTDEKWMTDVVEGVSGLFSAELINLKIEVTMGKFIRNFCSAEEPKDFHRNRFEIVRQRQQSLLHQLQIYNLKLSKAIKKGRIEVYRAGQLEAISSTRTSTHPTTDLNFKPGK